VFTGLVEKIEHLSQTVNDTSVSSRFPALSSRQKPRSLSAEKKAIEPLNDSMADVLETVSFDRQLF